MRLLGGFGGLMVFNPGWKTGDFADRAAHVGADAAAFVRCRLGFADGADAAA